MDIFRKTIVYVDDIHFSLVTLKDRLKEHYDVFLAQSAERLYEILDEYFQRKKFCPDLILLDLNMPGIDGFQILKELKQHVIYSDIPVIILSSRNDKKTLYSVLELGAVDFVFKPFTDSNLIECIKYQINPYDCPAKRPVVLVVDDNPSILKAVKHVLEDHYRIYLLQESQKVGEFLKRITPDLFLLDCNMPVLSGYDLVPVIRSSELHEETPIVFLTSDGTIDNLSAAIASGASDFIVKPINDTTLREKLAVQLEHFLIRRHIRESDQ